MKILYAGRAGPVSDYLRDVEDDVVVWSEPLTVEYLGPYSERRFDFLISCRYVHKIPPDVLAAFPQSALNLHPSYLPWNRGRFPNCWAWYDGTQHGATIHQLDEGWDTGPWLTRVLSTWPVGIIPTLTLAQTYHTLEAALTQAFIESWPQLRTVTTAPAPQQGRGSFHTAADFERVIRPLLTDGWRTPVSVLAEAGRKARDG